jgi:hypothetical protein
MKKRFAEHQSLKSVLQEFVSTHQLQEGLDKAQVSRLWKMLMGPAISKYTTRIYLDKSTLYVQLSSSVLREELSYGRQKIIQMINQELGKDLIQDLVLT